MEKKNFPHSFMLYIKRGYLYRHFKRCWNKICYLKKNEKKWKSCSINERLVQWKNNDRVCHIEIKNI